MHHHAFCVFFWIPVEMDSCEVPRKGDAGGSVCTCTEVAQLWCLKLGTILQQLANAIAKQQRVLFSGNSLSSSPFSPSLLLSFSPSLLLSLSLSLSVFLSFSIFFSLFIFIFKYLFISFNLFLSRLSLFLYFLFLSFFLSFFLSLSLCEVTGKRFFAKGVAYNPRNEMLWPNGFHTFAACASKGAASVFICSFELTSEWNSRGADLEWCGLFF